MIKCVLWAYFFWFHRLLALYCWIMTFSIMFFVLRVISGDFNWKLANLTDIILHLFNHPVKPTDKIRIKINHPYMCSANMRIKYHFIRISIIILRLYMIHILFYLSSQLLFLSLGKNGLVRESNWFIWFELILILYLL